MSQNVHPKPLTPLGYQQLTSFDGAAVGLDVPKDCTHIFWRAQTAGFRWRDDGTDPTTTVGQLVSELDPGDFYPGNPQELGPLRIIATGGTAVLNACFYKA
jgi:hypothetical protein